MATRPTGEQYELRHGAQRAVVTEVGAGLRHYSVGGRDVVEGFAADAPCTGGRGQTLIPWPNRVRGGRYTWRGRAQQLDLSEPARNGAIHGLTRWATWRLAELGPGTARLGYVLHDSPGWPHVLGCEVRYALDDAGLVVTTSVTNLGRDECPYGTGAHPYLWAGAPTVDEARVTIPARLHLTVDGDAIPTGEEPVDGTPFDLRHGRRLGGLRLDTTFTGLERDGDGRARARLEAPDGAAVVLWADQAYRYLQVFTGDGLAEPARRRTGLAIEPMTCAPDAFNSGAGLVVLAPGERHEASWGIEAQAAPGP